MDANFVKQLEAIKSNLLIQHKQLINTAESFSKGDIKDKLREIMYTDNKLEEKRIKVKKMPANMVLTKSGEVVFKFDNPDHAKIFFDAPSK